MKFSKILLTLTSLLASTAVAADNADINAKQAPAYQKFQPTDEKPFNFKIDYLIKGKQEKSSTEVVKVSNGETVSVVYNFTSGEEEPCTIIGVGGQLVSPVTGDVKANVTANQIGPLAVSTDESVTFIQNVAVNMIPDDYLFVPAVYIVYEKKFMKLGARNQIFDVTDPKISFFNPKLIVSELLLGATVAGLIYVLYGAFGKTYLKGILPSPTPKASKQKASKKSTTSISKSTGVDEWLPKTHLREITKKSKKSN